MLKSLKLLLPILAPSWQFFKEIAPSPRIEYKLENNKTLEANWVELTARPEKISLLNNLKRLFYNAEWNEYMFMINSAESLIIEASEEKEKDLLDRIIKYLLEKNIDLTNQELKFRLVFINRKNKELKQHILYESKTVRFEVET